jgi:hypothetical protein
MRGSYIDALAFDFKGIQKIHAKRFEICNVAGHNLEVMDQSGSSNHGVLVQSLEKFYQSITPGTFKGLSCRRHPDLPMRCGKVLPLWRQGLQICQQSGHIGAGILFALV